MLNSQNNDNDISDNQSPSRLEPSGENTITIGRVAKEARARALAYYGERAFAQMCLEFEANIVSDGCSDKESEVGEGDELTLQVLGLLKMLGQPLPAQQTGVFWQIALIWLDGRGLGEMNLEELNFRIRQFRSNQ